MMGATACSSEETTDPEQTTTDPAPTDETATTPGEADEAEDPAVALIESSCSLCHTTERVWAADYDRAGWETTIDRMKDNGLVISDEDYETIVVYLSNQ
jgi:cytochrome c5